MVVIGRRAGMENLVVERKKELNAILRVKSVSILKKKSALVSVIFVLEILGFGLMGRKKKTKPS